MEMTTDQERIIDALCLFGGGFAKVEPWGASEIALLVTLPGGHQFRVLDDGYVITGLWEGSGYRLAAWIYDHPELASSQLWWYS